MKSHPFSMLQAPKPDPIFLMSEKAHESGAEAIDATIGVCMNEQSEPLVFETTRLAERMRVDALHAHDFSYPPILGLQHYRESVRTLLLGTENEGSELASFATAGGQGALHTNLHLLKRMMPDSPLILPVPAWGNHDDLLRGAKIPVQEVAYLDRGKPTTEAIIHAIEHAHSNVAVLLQTSGHNPTGLDFSQEQWQELARVFGRKNTIAFLDCAYQGLTGEPEEDAAVPRLLAQHGIGTLIAWSASKNHSIYSYRTGLAGAIVQDKKTKRLVEDHYSDVSGELQSAAPTQGQAIVSIVQETLKKEWLRELKNIRTLIASKRHDLTELLNMEEFRVALQGNGLFAKLPLSEAQLEELRTEKKVFLLDDGRINIAGVPKSRIEELAKKIRSVVRR